jgi:hypothetical protein
MRSKARFLIVGVPLLLALASGRASAQNPFQIEGTVTDALNSHDAAHGSGSALKTTDPAGNSKELGPINGNPTKVGVIHTAPLPMLGLTGQNGQVDLNTIYTQTEKAANNNLWYYFGWVRDSNTGSGFISIEFEQAAAPAACDYATKTDAQLIAGCNPWANRQSGDFLLLWDQSGNDTNIYKRVFTGTAPNLTLGAAQILGTAVAQYSSDGFRGEAAVNLTADVFGNSGSCQTFANIIPNTVTGNSDTADYKDTVLKTFPPVTNCGAVTITKTTDPAGLTGTFTYTLAAGGASIFNSNAIDSDCSVSGTTGQCRGTLSTSANHASDTDTISNLLENDTNWTLGEDSPAADFEIKSIDCVLGSTTYHLFGAGQQTVANFKVEAGSTTACTIVNKLVKATVSASSAQTGFAKIKDSLTITGIKAGASDASSATVTFTLYPNATACSNETTPTGSSGPLSLTYGNPATTATATMTDASAISIAAGLTYYWKVTYSGDAFNNPATLGCGTETGTVTFTFVQ